MSERGIDLLEMADGQISDLIGLLSARGAAALTLPCPGREKLGDGTVAALALHTADNSLRIAGFLQTARQTPRAPAGTGKSHHRMPRFLLTHGHDPPGHAQRTADQGAHTGDYTAKNVDVHGLLERLSAARDALGVLADLGDEQLDAVPPTGSFRFCDGQRTLQEVTAALLNHQRHQVEALKAAVG